MTAPPLVFTGGPIRHPGHPEAVAVTNGHITALGPLDEVLSSAPADTEVVDLAGRMLTPGFQDAHLHPVEGGLQRLRCDLEGLAGAAQAIETIGRYGVEHPNEPWILGAGWKYDWFAAGNPAATVLDEITDRPTYLVVADGHSAWVNQRALDAAGVHSGTADPSDGIIVRLDDGSPQGTLHEGAMRLVESVLSETPQSKIDQALIESQEYLLGLGITAWQDAWVTPETDAAYRRLSSSGALEVRVSAALWWDRDLGVDQIDWMREASARPEPRYVAGTVKLMLDGVCENHTASMLEPYLDDEGAVTANRGIDFLDPDELPGIVSAIDASGLECHFHALGDRAVRNALDAIGHARSVNGRRDRRPHLAHLQVIHPDDIPRFAALGATANIQPYWAVNDAAMLDLTLPYLGSVRSRLQYPFASLSRTGANLAMGSDWPVSTPDVLQQIAVAVGRFDPQRGIEDAFIPEECLTLDEALDAVTIGSAYVSHFGGSGTIDVGQPADLAVLSGDPTIDPIHELEVDMTIVDGRLVYERRR